MSHQSRQVIRATREAMFRESVCIWIYDRVERDGIKMVSVAEPMQWRVMKEDDLETRPDPTLYLATDSAQQLMDELWMCGLRPTEGTGSAGSLAATQKHLEDMRTLVFHPPKP